MSEELEKLKLKLEQEESINTKNNETRLEEKKIDFEEEKQSIELKSLQQDVDLRREYAGKIYRLIFCWLIGVMILLIVQSFGRHIGDNGFGLFNPLSDKVLVTFIGGTTINIIGILYIVIRYLFPENKSKDKAV